MAASAWVADVTEADFMEQVVEQSKTRPVVVDFWAPWCGPCRAFSPLLERLAAEGNGAFFLAKINTDNNPNVAGEFGVEGIPAVFAVRDGQVVNQFVGLLPEAQLREFLGSLQPTTADGLLEQAEKLETTDPAKSAVLYQQALSEKPASAAAKVGLARAWLTGTGKEKEVAALLRDVVDETLAPETQRLGRILKLREHPASDADLATARAKTETAADLLTLGRVLAARGEYVPALDSLLAGAEKDRELGKAAIRELMVEIFHILGVRSPDSDAYRDKLRAILY